VLNAYKRINVYYYIDDHHTALASFSGHKGGEKALFSSHMTWERGYTATCKVTESLFTRMTIQSLKEVYTDVCYYVCFTYNIYSLFHHSSTEQQLSIVKVQVSKIVYLYLAVKE